MDVTLHSWYWVVLYFTKNISYSCNWKPSPIPRPEDLGTRLQETWILYTKVTTYLTVSILIWAGTLVIIVLRLYKLCLCLHSGITTRPRRKSKQ